MMVTDHELPAWAKRTFTQDTPDLVFAWTAVHTDEDREEWFFTGVVGELIRMRKLFRSISIALDMDVMVPIARMEYAPGGDGRDEHGELRALYTFMTFESFALLWNAKPQWIHGLDDERVSLHLKATKAAWPSRSGILRTTISFDGERFMATPHPEVERRLRETMGRAA